jgi:alpha-L-fucosidase
MLNIPLPNSGAPDEQELKVVDEITRWMAVNSEGIYDTRPWKVAGNVPETAAAEAGFNERNRKDLGPGDVRFTTKKDTLYAFMMGWPEHEASVPALALGGKLGVGKIRKVELLGHKAALKFTQDEAALRVELPPERPSDHAVCFRIVGV